MRPQDTDSSSPIKSTSSNACAANYKSNMKSYYSSYRMKVKIAAAPELTYFDVHGAYLSPIDGESTHKPTTYNWLRTYVTEDGVHMCNTLSTSENCKGHTSISNEYIKLVFDSSSYT